MGRRQCREGLERVQDELVGEIPWVQWMIQDELVEDAKWVGGRHRLGLEMIYHDSVDEAEWVGGR